MFRHLTLNKMVVVFLPVMMLGLFLMSSCKETEKIVTKEVIVHDTVEVVVEIISVDEVYTSPDSIAQGGTIMLMAEVTANEMVGDLEFHWFADAGEFDSPEGINKSTRLKNT